MIEYSKTRVSTPDHSCFSILPSDFVDLEKKFKITLVAIARLKMQVRACNWCNLKSLKVFELINVHSWLSYFFIEFVSFHDETRAC